MSRPAPPRELYTAHEVATRLAVDVTTVRGWCRKGAMESYRVGPHHLLRIPAAELAKHLRPAE